MPSNEWRHPDDNRVSAIKIVLFNTTKALIQRDQSSTPAAIAIRKPTSRTCTSTRPNGAAVRQWWSGLAAFDCRNGQLSGMAGPSDLCEAVPPPRPASHHQRDGQLADCRVAAAQIVGAGWRRSSSDRPAISRPVPRFFHGDDGRARFTASVTCSFVEGEVNGYLTYDRRPKVAPEAIRAIHAEGLRRRQQP